MKTTLLVVDESQIKDITFDDKHFFGIGEEEVILAASSGDEVEIPCITNHPNGWGLRTDNAYPIGIEYTNGYSGWLKAIKDGNPTDKKANLKLTAI